MESNNNLKEVDVKYCTCYFFDGVIKIEHFDLDNILKDEMSYENILVYNISYKSLIDSKSLSIRFNKVDEFIRIHDGIRYHISVKSGITYMISHNDASIKVDSYDFFTSIEKTMTLQVNTF